MITQNQILEVQDAWSEAIINIGSYKDNYNLCFEYTQKFLNKLYAFNEGLVLFKPTKAKDKQFRLTQNQALSYFIAGKNKVCKEDKGFALHPWKKIRFENAGYAIEDNVSIVMGNYYFTDVNQIDLKVEYTFGYKLLNEKLKIFLHHSSLPYQK